MGNNGYTGIDRIVDDVLGSRGVVELVLVYARGPKFTTCKDWDNSR